MDLARGEGETSEPATGPAPASLLFPVGPSRPGRATPERRPVQTRSRPIVLAHAHTLLNSTPEGATAFVNGDLRDPRNILVRAEATLDLGQPVAVMLVAVLHFIEATDDPYGIVNQLMDAMAPGSYLAISHGAADIDADNMALIAERLSERSLETFVWRTDEQVTRFFTGLELVDPGVALVDRWHPDPDSPPPGDRKVPFYGAIARKAQPEDGCDWSTRLKGPMAERRRVPPRPVTARSREVRVLADFSWRGRLRRRYRPARPQPRAPERTTARFDPDKLHPAWRPGVGFELRLGDGPGTPITRDGLRSHIAAARLVHGDGEADRLQAELNELLAIKERYDLATSAADARDAREGP